MDLARKEADELKQRCRQLEILLRSDRHSEDKIDPKEAPSISSDSPPTNGHDKIDIGHEHGGAGVDSLSLPQARLLLKVIGLWSCVSSLPAVY